MGPMRLVVAVLLGMSVCWTAHAGEMDERRAIETEVSADMARDDFASLEARYAKAVGEGQRFGSGVLVSGTIVRSLFRAPASASGTAVDEEFWSAAQARAHRWAVMDPKSVLAAMAEAQSHIGYAWAHRGGGYARTVTQDGWIKYRRHVELARQALEARSSAGMADPNWRRLMLYIGRMQGWPMDRYAAFATEAMDAFPGFYDTYFEVAIRLVPQWGGNLQGLAAFAEHAAQRTSSTEGRALYARIYWSVYHYLSPTDFESGAVDWQKVRAGFEDVIERYPDDWNMNFYARLSCDAGDRATTRRLLARIGDRTVPEAWDNRARFARCKSLAQE